MERGARRIRLLAGVGIASALLGVGAYLADVFHQPELDSVDLRFEIRGEIEPADELAVVGIDDVTFGALQERWPFPRRLHARVIERLVADGARAIAYDVQFTEPTDPRNDNALIDAVRRATRTTPVVLATTEVGSRGQTNVFGGEEQVRWSGARAANANLITDRGGVVRRTPHRLQRLVAFAVAAAEAPGDVSADPGDFGSDGAWIDFHGPPGTIDAHSFSDVMRGRFEPGTFEDRIVVVGPTAPSLQDVHPTSVGGVEQMAGPELQANAISTVRRGVPLAPSPGALDIAVIILAGLLAPLAALALSPVLGLLLAVGAGALYALAVQLLFGAGLILPLIVPLAALAVGSVGTVTVHYVTAALDRRRTRDIFARFVPETVVDQVLAGTDDDLRLGGVQLEGTVFFSDIRGFTTFSESHEAAEVLQVLNHYLSAMSDTILEHGGTLTTYIGDGIMAVFGAPIPQTDHADRALAASRAMLDEEMPRINAWLEQRGHEPFSIGIGLNSGSVMAGNVGSEKRLEYTAIGDTVNTAARLEGMTKDTPHSLFVADSTRACLTRPVELSYVDDLAVRGRRATVRVWTISEPGRAAQPAPEADREGAAPEADPDASASTPGPTA